MAIARHFFRRAHNGVIGAQLAVNVAAGPGMDHAAAHAMMPAEIESTQRRRLDQIRRGLYD